MYELVNTSVPNGLMPGSRGFATVAMTKGMPDAVRTRIESFCAYPHRTSAHDQSYYSENPVNWFHLVLPNGDHVVGRTAPAEFDYTGRTNRISRTIYFGAREMPMVGGAYILTAESRRFCEAWSGEPRYLKEDKATSGRLRMADLPKDTEPKHWVEMFGPDGLDYARRFALLLAKNIVGAGKSIYFKASASSDSDGTRLLGLFSDLINLLPENLVAKATFSTFSACVPNGVVCHLRGIYDKDRAFEVASATQPWVDCEHGRVMHEELLPKEGAAAAAVVGPAQSPTSGVGSSVVNSGRDSSIGLRKDDSAKAAQAAQNRNNRWHRQDDGDKSLYITIGVLAAIALCVAIGCVVWIQKSSPSAVGTDEIMREAKAEAEQEKNRDEEERIAEQRRRGAAEREELATKEKAEKDREKAERKRKEAEEIAKAESQGKKITEEYKKKQDEEEKRAEEELKKAKGKCLSKSLAELSITKVIDKKPSETFNIPTADLNSPVKIGQIDHVLAKYLAVLTNENSIVVYYAENGVVKSAKCHFNGESKPKIGTSQPKTIFTAVGWPEKADTSPWVVCRVVNPDWRKDGDKDSLVVFWWWNEQPPVRLFENSDEADLAKLCFGCDEAKKVWQEYTKENGGGLYYAIAWDDNVWIQIEDKVKLESFCNTNALEALRKKYDNEIEELENKIKSEEDRRVAAETLLEKIDDGKKEMNNIDKGIGFGNDKLSKDEKKRKIRGIKGDLLKRIKKYDKKYKDIKETMIEMVEKELKKIVASPSQVATWRKKIGALESKRDRECDLNQLADKAKKRQYFIRLLPKLKLDESHEYRLGLNTKMIMDEKESDL